MTPMKKERLEELNIEIEEIESDLYIIRNCTLRDWAREHLEHLKKEKKDIENEDEAQRWIF